MTKFNSHVIRHNHLTELTVSHGATHATRVPSVGGKMYRRTSESAGSIH